MKENRMDSITDILKNRVAGIVGEARRQFKGSNPYRQEPKSTEQKLLEYADFTPDVESNLRQNFGDLPVDVYKGNMEQLIGRMRNNA